MRFGRALQVDLEAVRDAVGRVEDPEIHRPIADLGMLGEVAVRGGRVRVEVRLTTPTCPLRETFGAAVTAAVHLVAPGVEVEVAFGALDERARRDLSLRLRGPGRGIPVPAPGSTPSPAARGAWASRR